MLEIISRFTLEKKIRYWTTLLGTIALMLAANGSVVGKPLEGQIILHPENPSYFALYRNSSSIENWSPYFMVGPGGPEDFLYRGSRNANGTRSGDQMLILEQMVEHGGNVMYFQSIRSHGGDGLQDHNPFNDPSDPESGLNPKIIEQWRGWFDFMDANEITLFFFIYDDGVHAFDNGITGKVGETEHAYVSELVQMFSEYPRLVWVVQEEFKYVGQGETGAPGHTREPDDEARRQKMIELAKVIKEADPHEHLVGVHHNWNGDSSDPYRFEGIPEVDVYIQQADVFHRKGKATPERMYQEVKGAFRWEQYPTIMGEAYNLHKIAIREGNRDMVRQANWACVLGGAAGLNVLGTWERGAASPSSDMLGDMRRLELFVESIDYWKLKPSVSDLEDATIWYSESHDKNAFLVYSRNPSSGIAVSFLPSGRYRICWFDPVDGSSSFSIIDHESGSVIQKPDHLGIETVIYLSHE